MTAVSRHKFADRAREPEVSDLRPMEIRFTPPEIIVATNGYIVKSYDVPKDEMVHQIARDADELRDVLDEWVESMCCGIKRMVDMRIQKASVITPRNSDAA